MKPMITLLVVIVLIVVGVFLIRREPVTPPPPPPESGKETDAGGENAEAAAKDMMKFLEVLADSQFHERLGFKSVDEVKEAELGRPIPYRYLQCDSVQAYDTAKGGDLGRLVFGDRVFYPLNVRGLARSAFLVDSLPNEKTRKGRDWTVAEFGKSNLAVLADSLIKKISGSSGIPDSLFSLVEIPAMRLTYLAFPGQGGTYLHPISKGICWPAKEGESAPVASVLSGLAGCKELALACNEPQRHRIAWGDMGAPAGDSSTLKKGPSAK